MKKMPRVAHVFKTRPEVVIIKDSSLTPNELHCFVRVKEYTALKAD